jgi:hypothetical protein
MKQERKMKKLIVIMTMLASTTAFASPATKAEKRTVLKAVMTDVMLRGALAEARKSGKCEGSVVSAMNNGNAGTEFEAQVNCTAPDDDENTGGGTFLMINVKGRVFGDSLENSVITVEKAG